MVEGAFTLNARTDCDYTNTLPNHTCQITGRNVLGPDGHSISFNSDSGGTIEDAHGSYVAGVFDATHDHGYGTALFAGKSKFDLFDRSWNAVNGAPDITGEDNGRDKIDHYLYLGNTESLVDSFVSLLESADPGFAFLHLRDPDSDGHAYGWMSAEYIEAVIRMDTHIGKVMATVEGSPALAASTVIIVTADHGGTEYSHHDPTLPVNYTIQFHAWGLGVPAGADIYTLNTGTRLDPGTSRPPCGGSDPPIRNGESANAATSLLGLPPVSGSTMGSSHTLVLTAPGLLPWTIIQSPSNGSLFAPGETVLIEAEAGGPSAITKVEFFVDWRKIGEDDTAPFELLWDELSLGTHDIAVRACNTGGYGATDMIRVEVISTVSDELHDSGGWDRPRVYPNPAGTNPSLLLYTNAPGPVDMTLYDAAGRMAGRQILISASRGRQTLDLDMQGYPSGVYFFRAVSGNSVWNGKFILIR
jgi:hypothetical protein